MNMDQFGFSYNNITYTINSRRDGPVMYATLTIPKDIEAEVETKLMAMNDDFVDAKMILEKIKNDKLD